MRPGCAVLATNKTRIHDEPAFVLHHYDWSESSLILDMFTRHHGRVALAAKGVKRPSSQFRPVLLPLQPLRIGYSGEAEVRALKSAEWVGGHIMPQGDALLSGYYLNELLMRLLARDDAHPRLFDLYSQVVHIIAAGHDGMTAPALRAFELLLLRDLGFLPDLSCQTSTLGALDPHTSYCLLAEAGLREMNPQDRAGLVGQDWLDLQHALNEEAPLTSTLRLCAQWPAETRQALQTQLRHVLHYHCGVQTLRTRQVLMDLQAL